MNAVLMVMPIWMRPYAKAAVAVLGGLLSAAAVLWADRPEVSALLSLATALGVYAQPNEETS